jgi:hypothetical protein
MSKKYDKIMRDFVNEEKIRLANEKIIKDKEIEYVKNHIDYDFDLIEEYLIDEWMHESYVEVEETDYKSGEYLSAVFYKEKDNEKSLLYMKQDEEGKYHNMVWQTVGYCEDDYSGYLLFPLNNGTYWKISYSC